MSPNDYIEKAKHALATDQPNLAMLYMKRGCQVLDRQRIDYLKATPQGQLILVGEAIAKLGDSFYKPFQPTRAINDALSNYQAMLLQAHVEFRR